MAFALALSVSASVGIGIVSLARITYGMAGRQVLPAPFGRVSLRFSTPAVGSIVMGAALIAITWVYLLSTSIATLFSTLISVDGLLYAGFYILTTLAAIAYYWSRIISSAWDALLAGVLPAAAIGFLAWIIVRTVQTSSAPARWSLIGIAGWRACSARRSRFGRSGPAQASGVSAAQLTSPGRVGGRPAGSAPENR